MQSSRTGRDPDLDRASQKGRTGRSFLHPEPPRPGSRIWPVYLTYQGCPGRCVFCAQHLQSAATPQPLDIVLENMVTGLVGAERDGRGPYELAFYGGVFTALPGDWPDRFLAAASRFRQTGLITRVRCSTRPDACGAALLARLRKAGLDLVELGVQTFDDAVLAASGRGHDAQATRQAVAAVAGTGLALGIQLLPGLPGHTPAMLADDVAQTAALAPECVRIHPCVVPDKTPLAALYQSGNYVPWDLDTTMEALAEALPVLWRAGVRVARLGLAPEPGFDAAILAGPRHPALGSRVRARALLTLLAAAIQTMDAPVTALLAPRRFAGELFGHAGELIPAYAALGLTRERIRFEERRAFFLATDPA